MGIFGNEISRDVNRNNQSYKALKSATMSEIIEESAVK